MELSDYLARIGYEGSVAPDLACLNGVHRSHLRSIPYENLDVQLQRPVDQDIGRIFEKMVGSPRGGWCYEMNGLLCWALREIGFDVMRMTGGVGRKERGDDALGNHLVLCVRLGEPYVADVGIGSGIAEPIPLRDGRYSQDGRAFDLESLGEDMWRFHNTKGAMPPDFDFRFASADEDLLARTGEELQRDPESMFRQNLVCFRSHADGTHMLLGRVLMRPDAAGPVKTLLNTADELVQTLDEVFGVRDPDAGDVWRQVEARHEALFGDLSAQAISFGPE